MEPALLVALGGAGGAVSRYIVGQIIRSTSFPWATLAVNVLGSFLLGVVLFGGESSELLLVVGVGFCGAFTTFSSFSFQTVALWEQGEQARAVVNAAANLVVSLVAFGVAWLVVV